MTHWAKYFKWVCRFYPRNWNQRILSQEKDQTVKCQCRNWHQQRYAETRSFKFKISSGWILNETGLSVNYSVKGKAILRQLGVVDEGAKIPAQAWKLKWRQIKFSRMSGFDFQIRRCLLIRGKKWSGQNIFTFNKPWSLAEVRCRDGLCWRSSEEEIVE